MSAGLRYGVPIRQTTQQLDPVPQPKYKQLLADLVDVIVEARDSDLAGNIRHCRATRRARKALLGI
jgi:hypothetical protein